MSDAPKRKEYNTGEKTCENESKRIKTTNVQVRLKDKNIWKYKNKKITGKEFCRLFPKLSKELVKPTDHECNNTECNNTECSNADGIYFIHIKDLPEFVKCNRIQVKYYRTVTILEDYDITIYEHKFKADKIKLGERVKINELDDEYCLEKVKKDGHSIRNLLLYRDVPEKIKMAAVRQNVYVIGDLLYSKTEISEKVILEAIKKDARIAIKEILEYNHYQRCFNFKTPRIEISISEEIQMEVAKRDGSVVIKHLLNRLSCPGLQVSDKVIKVAEDQIRESKRLLDIKIENRFREAEKLQRDKIEEQIRKIKEEKRIIIEDRYREAEKLLKTKIEDRIEDEIREAGKLIKIKNEEKYTQAKNILSIPIEDSIREAEKETEKTYLQN